MFANIFLLSLLTIIYGTKGDEGGGGSEMERSAANFLPQQRSSDGTCKYLLFVFLILCNVSLDANYIKTPRSIRTPFRNTEIMTARGFGKRDGDQDIEYLNESENLGFL